MSQGPASPGVAGPPVAPQASDLVSKFHAMLKKPKAPTIVDEEKEERKEWIELRQRHLIENDLIRID